MKKYFKILFLLFLSTQLSSAQSTEEEILKDLDFTELKETAIAYYTSDVYMEFEKLNREFESKLPANYFTEKTNPFEDWIQNNIELTKFNSVEEALSLYDKVSKASDETFKDEEMIYKLRLVFTLSEKYGVENFSPIYDKYVFNEIYKVWNAKNLQNHYLDSTLLNSSVELQAIQRKGAVMGHIIEDTNNVFCIDSNSNKRIE